MNWEEHLKSCINNGHCDECKEKQLKNCDECAGLDRVEFRPSYENKCLCFSCRQGCANQLAKTRSW